MYDYVWMDKNPRSRFYLVDFGSKHKLEDMDIPIMSLEDPNDHTIIITICDVWSTFDILN